MSNFLSHIINRHIQASDVVTPRRRSLFEPESYGLPGSIMEGRPWEPGQDLPEEVRDSLIPAKEPVGPKWFDTQLSQSPERRQSLVAPIAAATSRPAGPDKPGIQAISYQAEAEEKLETARERTGQKAISHSIRGVSKSSPQTIIQPLTAAKQRQSGSQSAILQPIWNILPTRKPRHKDQPPNGLQMEAQPTVKIHIGRIEVKAAGSTLKPRETRKAPNKPKMTLEQFLEKREGKSS